MATPPLPSKSPKAQKSAFGEKVVYRWGADIVAAVEAGVQAEQHARIRAISFAAAQSAIDRLEASGGPRASESEVLLQAVRDALADAGIRADDLTERTFGTSREPTPGWLLEGLGGSSPHPPRDGVASRWLIVEPPAESPHALTVVPAAAFVAAETPKVLNSPWLLSESSTPAPAPREPTVAPRGTDLAEKWAPRPVVAAAAASAAVGGTAPHDVQAAPGRPSPSSSRVPRRQPR